MNITEENRTFQNETVLNWLNTVTHDSVKAYKLISGDSICYIFSSVIERETGLAVNFTSWLIIEPNSNFTESFMSLSDDKKLIYLDEETGRLRYAVIDFADSFFHRCDWSDIEYAIAMIEVVNGKAEVMSTSNAKCIGH